MHGYKFPSGRGGQSDSEIRLIGVAFFNRIIKSG